MAEAQPVDPFESGVTRFMGALQPDSYKPTLAQKELARLHHLSLVPEVKIDRLSKLIGLSGHAAVAAGLANDPTSQESFTRSMEAYASLHKRLTVIAGLQTPTNPSKIPPATAAKGA